MTTNTVSDLQTLVVRQHRIALVVPFTFALKNPEHIARFDARILASDPQLGTTELPAGLQRAATPPAPTATPPVWRRYAGALNDTPGANATVNPAYDSLYPQAQQVVHNPLGKSLQSTNDLATPFATDRAHPHAHTADTLLCLPYTLNLDGLQWPEAQTAEATPEAPAAVRLHAARLLLFRTGVGILVLLLDAGADAMPADRLLDALRGLAEPHNCAPDQPHARIADQLDILAAHLLHSALGDAAHLHLRRKTWASAAHAPAADHAQLQRLALLLGHRQTTAYALLPEHMQDAVYAPFAYVAHAVSVGGTASVVGDDDGAKRFVDIFVDRVWSHTYLPLLLLPLHQHYFYLRHAEWEPLSPRAHATVRKLEERFEDNLDFQAHFGSALVGQIDLHNAYVRTATQHLRLHERAADYERATRDYAGMLRVRRQGKLRWIEVFGSAGAAFIIVRELLDALMQNGFIWAVPEPRAWFALLQRWTPEQTTAMIERVHHWDQAVALISLAAAALAGLLAWYADRRIAKE